MLDATTGQNAHSQLEIFKNMYNVTGLIVTKLDCSAKGGVLALAETFKLPVMPSASARPPRIWPVDAEVFAKGLMGV